MTTGKIRIDSTADSPSLLARPERFEASSLNPILAADWRLETDSDPFDSAASCCGVS